MSHELPSTPEQEPRDLSKEFLELSDMQFSRLVESVMQDPLSITVEYKQLGLGHDALDLKIFCEQGRRKGAKRKAVIRGTEKDYNRADIKTVNALASGVEWEMVEG